MQKAIDLSNWAVDNKHFPIAAIIVGPNGKELAATTNTELDPNAPLGGTPIAHAEISAIVEASRKLGTRTLPPGSRMYTTCEPCIMCLGAMNFSGIDSFVYANSIQDTHQFRSFGFKDKDLYDDAKKDPAARAVPGFQLLEQPAFSVLQRWQAQLNAQGIYSFDSPEGKKYLSETAPKPKQTPFQAYA